MLGKIFINHLEYVRKLEGGYWENQKLVSGLPLDTTRLNIGMELQDDMVGMTLTWNDMACPCGRWLVIITWHKA